MCSSQGQNATRPQRGPVVKQNRTDHLQPCQRQSRQLLPHQATGVLTHLHPNDGIDEEKHGNQKADIGESLQGKQETIINQETTAPISARAGTLIPRLFQSGLALLLRAVLF